MATECVFNWSMPVGDWRPMDDGRLSRIEERLGKMEDALARLELLIQNSHPNAVG
jgi:hypothetical protein